jgi:hypothetical protein
VSLECSLRQVSVEVVPIKLGTQDLNTEPRRCIGGTTPRISWLTAFSCTVFFWKYCLCALTYLALHSDREDHINFEHEKQEYSYNECIIANMLKITISTWRSHCRFYGISYMKMNWLQMCVVDPCLHIVDQATCSEVPPIYCIVFLYHASFLLFGFGWCKTLCVLFWVWGDQMLTKPSLSLSLSLSRDLVGDYYVWTFLQCTCMIAAAHTLVNIINTVV